MPLALCWALRSHTFPGPKLGLTVTFLATEEHGSRAGPELESDWGRKLQSHHDLQGAGCVGGSREDGVTQAHHQAGRWRSADTLRAHSPNPDHTHFMGSLDLTVLSAPRTFPPRRTSSEKNVNLTISFLLRSRTGFQAEGPLLHREV